MYKAIAVLGLLLLVACNVGHAQEAARSTVFDNAHPKNPIEALQLSGTIGHFSIKSASVALQLSRDISKERADLHAAIQHLDDSVAPAVRYARGRADLVKAIKDYYTAASTYLANGIPLDRFQKISADRLESDYRAKEKALELEIKLAGIK